MRVIVSLGLVAVVSWLSLLSSGCGGSSAPMNGPTISGSLAEPAGAPGVQSDDVLGREAVTSRAFVKHVLIGWRELGGDKDPRAARRTRAEADALALDVLRRLRAGEPIEALMLEISEDPGSRETGEAYEVTPDAELVFEFKRLGLRLQPKEAGIVESRFGWHVIQRVK